MKINVMAGDDRIFTLDVDADESVENVKALLEVETGVAIAAQRLLHNGRDAKNTATLRALGVLEGDLIVMNAGAGTGSGTGSGSLSLNPDGSAVDPAAVQQHLRANPNVIGQLLNSNPEFAQAIMGDDLEALQSLLRQQHRQKMELQRRQQEEIALLNADPFDLDAQRRIEENIRQKNIDENWEAALEHNPEAFARVIMLYVDMEVNGVPIKAFVDSGAQMTIISKSCAERCGLLRLLDKRYVGIAKGVGQSAIIGRVHVAHLKIGGKFFMCSFTVLEQSDVEFIFGLDMLRKHQCAIDLNENVLRVGGGEIAVPFLQEKDLPDHIREPRDYGDLLPSKAQGAASTSAAPAPMASTSLPKQSNPQPSAAIPPAAVDEKVARLMQLGFDHQTCLRALQLFNGNEDQAASYLFGG